MMLRFKLTVRAIALASVLVASGCVVGHQQFVTYQAPMKYPPAKSTWVFEYANVDLRHLKDVLFSDFLTLAESSFEGPYEDPTQSRYYATQLGADVFIVSTQFKETQTSVVPLTVPSASTTSFSGNVGTQSFSGLATTYGTSTTMIPVAVERYRQQGIYLRNVNNVKPLWLKTRADFTAALTSDFDGTWRNDKYRVDVYRSEGDIVGVIRDVLDGSLKKTWQRDEMKFLFGASGGNGVYLMADRTPMPARVSLNKFGFLEIELIVSGEKFSFARDAG